MSINPLNGEDTVLTFNRSVVMDLLELIKERTLDQDLTLAVIKNLQEYEVDGNIVVIATFPILSTIADETTRAIELDSFKKSMTEICNLLSLKYTKPNFEFSEKEIDGQVNRCVSIASSIFANTSVFNPYLEPEQDEMPSYGKLKSMVLINVVLVVTPEDNRMITESVLVSLNEETNTYNPQEIIQ
jgi:hypothetical protein